MKVNTARRKGLRLTVLAVGVSIAFLPWVATSFTNTLVFADATIAGITETEVTIDSLKPAGCVGPTTLTFLRTNSATSNTTASADLVLGDGGNNTLNGGDGDDCLVSGGGTDTIDGGGGNDVCLGNATTTFLNCEISDPNGS